MWLGNKSNDKLLEHGSRALGFVDIENFLGSWRATDYMTMMLANISCMQKEI